MSGWKKLVIALFVMVFIAAAGAGAAGYYYYDTYMNIEEVYPGISVGNMDMSGLTRQEMQKKVDDYVADIQGETITIKVGKKEESFLASDIGLTCADPEVTDQAYRLGREGNLIERARVIYGLTKEGKSYPITFTFDKEAAKKKIIATEKTFLAKKKNATITRKNGKFKVTKEVNGIDMDLEANADKLISKLEQGGFEKGPIEFTPEYEEDKADVTKKELSVIKNKLGTFTTSYAGSTEGRCANVENGAAHINGTLLFPGDSFSVHDAVTPFTKENGYELAGSYENGTTIQTYGGGICQVSTTLYNAVLRAELEVLERDNHSMTVHYVDLSEDAAISGDEKDFRFKNNLDHPVYIVGATDHDDRTITFTIYGKEYRDKNRTIEFVSETTGTYPPKQETIKDKTLKKGKKVVEKTGHTGYTAKLWKVIHVKGKKDKTELVNTSSYMSTPTVVRVGTKKEEKKEKKKKEKKEEEKKDDKEETT